MKAQIIFIVTGLPFGLTSCADLFGTKSDYQRGLVAGRAQIIRQRYWEERNKPVEAPVLEKRYTPIAVPEYTTPDGVIIEPHDEIVETVR